MKRKTWHLVVGVLLLLATAFWALATVAFFIVGPSDPSISATGYIAFSGACTAIFAVPAFLLLYMYRRASSRDKELQKVGAVLRSVREISVRDIAARIGASPAEAEGLISESISEGYAQGYLDPKRGVFVATAWGTFPPGQVPQIVIQAPAAVRPDSAVPRAADGPAEVRYCRECGGRVERIRGADAWKCPHCGNVQ